MDFETASLGTANPVLFAGTSIEAVSRIPPATSGFKRSIALLGQIQSLNQTNPPDYTLHAGTMAYTMDFKNPAVKAAFTECRNRALTTGDRESVATMTHLLCWITLTDKGLLASGGPSSQDIVDQLKREYNFPELSIAVQEMHARTLRNSDCRPYVPLHSHDFVFTSLHQSSSSSTDLR